MADFFIDWDPYEVAFGLYVKDVPDLYYVALAYGTEKELLELVKNGQAATELEEYLNERGDSG